jgi:hypothetical protein
MAISLAFPIVELLESSGISLFKDFRVSLRSMGIAAEPQIVALFVAQKKHQNYKYLKEWSEWQDSNLRPLRPERSALPG